MTELIILIILLIGIVGFIAYLFIQDYYLTMKSKEYDDYIFRWQCLALKKAFNDNEYAYQMNYISTKKYQHNLAHINKLAKGLEKVKIYGWDN